MTTFGTLFRELLHRKNRSAYWVFLIQLIVSLIITIFGFISSYREQTAQLAGIDINGFWAGLLSWIIVFLSFTFLAEPIYLLMTSWKNEKINRSQTWRLIPMSDTKLYLGNTLSSFTSYIYLAVLQAAIGLIGCLIAYGASSEVRKGVAQIFSELGRHAATVDWGNFGLVMIEFLVLAFLVGLFWYVVVSFYHFVYRAVMDFLPQANSWVLFLVRAIALIVVIVLLVQLIGHITDLFDSWGWFAGANQTQLGVVILEFIIFDALFAGLNIWLIERFVEAKQN